MDDLKSPFGGAPFGTTPFGPSPGAPFNANISIGANGVGEGLTELVGEANLDFDAVGVFVPIEDTDGEAAFEIAANGAGAFTRPRVRVIATAPHTRKSVSGLVHLQGIASAPSSKRSRTGLSHTGLN